ncbi:MAG: Xaa-Pro aminopeptidase [Gammaproteobacteria bacterium]|nr:MAG: Xaa-Pro aminopeptidase [Gammaproteobacteria bacterium]
MKKPIVPMQTFAARRQQLLQEIGDKLLILPANSELIRNRDCHFPFRQDSDFLYLSNFNEPDAVLVLDGKAQKSLLFSKPLDALHAIWEGEIIGQERAKTDYLFDEAYALEALEPALLKYFYTYDSIITPFSRYSAFDCLLLKLIKQAKETRRARAPQNWLNSDQFIHPLRLQKDSHEIQMMQYAADISVVAHQAAMRETQPGMNEAEIAALLDYHFAKAGGTAAYGHIVAAGNHACTLHYTDNNAQVLENDLILLDAGCEIDGYAADITRTFPVSGKFTEPQKRVYEWVLQAMQAAFAACKVGNTIRRPHLAAEKVLIEAMLDLGLLTGDVDSVRQSKAHQKYFMHGTSHWLGMDVHDVGDYQDENEHWLTLLPGMVITIEPGLYIREDDMDAPEELRGIGVRIEDDILLTEDGYRNLTAAAPKTVAEVEAACQGL